AATIGTSSQPGSSAWRSFCRRSSCGYGGGPKWSRSEPMLQIQGAFKTFHAGTPNEVRALRGIDLTIDEGSFVVVIGTNGSGKSTLLNAVAGTFLLDEGH